MEIYLDDPAVTATSGLRTELCVPVIVQGTALRASAS
jgi:DNA gyrase inhibitor GyrI